MAGSTPRKRVTDLLTSVGIEFATRLRGLALIPLLINEIGVDGYGAYAQVISVVIITAQVATLGSEFTLVRHGTADGSRAKYYYTAVAISVFLGCLISGVFTVIAEPVSRLLVQTSVYDGAFLVGGYLIVTRAVARVQRNYYRSMNRIKSFNGVRGGMAYISLIGVFIGIYFYQMSVVDVLLIIFATELFGLALVQIPISKSLGISIPTYRTISESIRYGGEVLVSNFASISLTRSDRILVGIFLGAASVGIYDSLYRLVSGMKMLMRPLRDMAFPEFIELWENNEKKKMEAFLAQGIHLLSVGMMPLVVGGYLVGDKLFAIVVGASNTVDNLLILIVAIGIFFLAIQDFVGQVYYATDRTRTMVVAAWVAAVLNLGLNIILIPQFGIFAAGATTLLSYGLLAFWLVSSLGNIISPTYPLQELGLTFLCCLLMGIFVIWLPTDNIVLEIGLGGIIYVILILLSGAFQLSHIANPEHYIDL